MKKPWLACFSALILIFCGFALGFFYGRQAGGVEPRDRSVPTVSAVPDTEPETLPIPSPINLNTATAEELTTLPGIGEVLAGRIVAYREQYGPFLCVDELKAVYGIDEKKLEAVRNLVTTGG